MGVHPIVMLATSAISEYILTTLNVFQTLPHTALLTAYQTTEHRLVIPVLNVVIQVHIAIQVLDNVINHTSILVNVVILRDSQCP